MGKIIPRSSCSFTPSIAASAGMNWGPQALNNNLEPIALGIGNAPCSVRLEDPGTYLLLGRIHFAGNFQAGDVITYALIDVEQELEIGDTALLKVPLANAEWEQEFIRIHTINSPRRIYINASNNTANRGGVVGIRTGIQFFRIK